jgi:outer membrane receptor protein involved in Fe transport
LRDEASLFERKLIFVPAARADWNDETDFRVLPSFGVVVSPRPWVRLKANVERAFRNPSFGELFLPDRGFISGNDDLDPEKSDNYDVGLELAFDRIGPLRDVTISGSVFYSDVENTIIWVFVSPTRIQPVNSDDATAKGYELSASIGIGPFVTVSSNHTYVDAEYDSGPRLPGRAKSETNLRLQIANPDVFKLVGQLQHTGSISVSVGGSYIIPSRDVWNASAGLNLVAAARAISLKPPLDHLWLSLAVDNIADDSIQDSLYFPQPGRSYGITLEAKW